MKNKQKCGLNKKTCAGYKDGDCVSIENCLGKEIKQDFKMQEELAKEIEQIFNTGCLLNQGGKCIDCEYTDKNTDEYDCHSYLLAKKLIENIYKQAEQTVLANIADGGTSRHWCIEQHKKLERKETAEKILNFAQGFFEWDEECFVWELTKYIKTELGVEIKE